MARAGRNFYEKQVKVKRKENRERSKNLKNVFLEVVLFVRKTSTKTPP